MNDSTFTSRVRKDITLSTEDLAKSAGVMFAAGANQISKDDALKQIQEITGVELLSGQSRSY